MKREYSENDIDKVFRKADFGIRQSHKDELYEELFCGTNDELSEDQLFAAAGGNKKPEGSKHIEKLGRTKE
ncbi:MAG: hypothetical protein K6A90_04770 [Lachnospiraceae bacterium]|nr:hypothetical protein [Lachnospiraceae bacterium]